jgi:two-component SAPR family response regulator
MVQRLKLAKLTRPHLYRTVSRERLHSQFDRLRESYPAIWVTGPPGAGKTTCVSDYLQVRELPGIWYQLDNNDTDPASFFYHMRMAAQTSVRADRLDLPLLTSEYLPGLAGFSRFFFRKLFSLYSRPAVFVLDNYHEIPVESVLHSVIDTAISELPPSHTLVVISRMNPPSILARALANNCLGKIQWHDLRLTVEEISVIAAAAGLARLTEETMIALENQSDGWVAGLTLLIQGIKHEQEIDRYRLTDNKEVIFNYFASQVFERLNADIREFLLSTSILPEITVSTAMRLSKNTQPQQHLDYLYQRRLFINRRHSADQFYYQYHALFREFLLVRAKAHFSVNELKELKEIGADIVETNGEFLASAGLLADVQAWEALHELILRQAATLMNQGRNQTLQEIIAYLPPSIIQDKPWLLYWRGMCYLITDPDKARQNFEQAFSGFRETHDIPGQLLACGEIFEAYHYLENDIRPVIQWADQLQDLLNLHGCPSFEIEVALLSKLQGLMFAAPHHSLFESFEKRLKAVFSSEILPFQKLAIASTFVFLSLWRGESHKALWLFKETNLIVASEKEILPVLRILWLHVESAFAWSTTAEHEISDRKFLQALQIGKENEISLFNSMLIGHGVYGSLAAGEVKQARKYLELMTEYLSAHRKHEITQFYFLTAGVEFLDGNITKALHHATLALELYEELGRPFLIEAARSNIAQILIESNDFTTAYAYLKTTLQYARLMRSKLLEAQCLLIESYGRMKQGNIDLVLIPLREGLRIARQIDLLYLNTWWRPHTMAEIFHIALEHTIEVDYVKSVIYRRRMRAVSLEYAHWAWPIKIYTLGEFKVECNDTPLSFRGKVQQKPLELLKFLCAFDRKAVSFDTISDALWPDSTGDAAEQALSTTLHRLRKLLHHDQAIVLEDKHLSLDPGYVWTDCGVFCNLVHQPNIMHDCTTLQQAFNAYPGSFLEGAASPWAINFRDQLRLHYTRIVEQYGTFLEQDNDFPAAIDCYQKAIEIEPLIEVFYRHLINLYLQLGRQSEALAIYQRCNQSLLAHLGIKASSATQSLYQKIISSH